LTVLHSPASQGEEQSLFGARHMTSHMKQEKTHVIAMITNDIIGNSLSNETDLRQPTRTGV